MYGGQQLNMYYQQKYAFILTEITYNKLFYKPRLCGDVI